MQAQIRTRIAPSPTGALHLGTARMALFCWAYARHFEGQFILRIEDTDQSRSTQESVDQILAGLSWLGLNHDEGPFYQMQRLDRYHEVVEKMIAAGTAYRCYATPQELDAMRNNLRERGEKTLYDRRWRPEPGKVLPPIPDGVKPVVRFANPTHGSVVWNDLVKGSISIRNEEIDDVIILRQDGIPTYNFAVVVDDLDMKITHVFRGDEHVNNTPWQINIWRAIADKEALPVYAHCPVILGEDGLKLSKRRGATSITSYRDEGYLPEAMLNYLARLGWSHGNDEMFSVADMVNWFDGTHLAKGPAKWDPVKLSRINAHYLKLAENDRLANLMSLNLSSRDIPSSDQGRLSRIAALFKDRCDTVSELSSWAEIFLTGDAAERLEDPPTLTEQIKTALIDLLNRFDQVVWEKEKISGALNETLTDSNLKMSQLAPVIRHLLCGTTKTPSLDSVIELFDKEAVRRLISRALI